MSTIVKQPVYPQNGTTNAATVNSDFSAIATATADINEQNVRQEGIDFRNIGFNPNIQYMDVQDNETQVDFFTDATTYSAWTYEAYSNAVGGGTKEWALNHNSSPPVTSTSAGSGTKLQLNGAAGITPQPGDIIKINWSFVVWETNSETTPIQDQCSDVPRASSSQGGGIYGTGSGIGEVCWLVYPKVNVTSSALVDADFETLSASGLRATSLATLDPKNVTPGIANAQPVNGATQVGWDHVTVVPHIFIAANNTQSSAAIAYYTGDGNSFRSDGFLNNPNMMSGSVTIEVDADFSGTLYGIELFLSGLWRMKATSLGYGNSTIASLFLEDETCDPTNDLYGYEGRLTIERAHIMLTHYTKEGA
jgi:hypothetical protein